MKGDSVVTSQMTSASVAKRAPVTIAQRARSVMGSRERAHRAGRRSLQGRASSKAADAARTVASACRRPTICRPTGNPSSVQPAGTEAAGWPVRLNGNERHPAKDRGARARDLARRRVARSEREHRDGRHQKEIEALEERVHLAPVRVRALEGPEILPRRDGAAPAD